MDIAKPAEKDVWREDDALWLLTRSSLLPGLWQRALFVTALSFGRALVRGWGFWETIATSPIWIGPRHTNFPDGSICAFDPADKTWLIGDSVVELIDLYTLWALRHLHLQIFGRWPGRQSAHYPSERIAEINDDEYCGCGKSDRRYRDCCKHADLARDQVRDAVNYQLRCFGGLRFPPRSVTQFVSRRSNPPRIDQLLS